MKSISKNTFERMVLWMYQMIILNIIWFLFSLPLVTIVPSTDTLFEIMPRVQAQNVEIRSTYNLFWSSFKKNFKQSYKRNWPILVIFFVFVFDFKFFNLVQSSSIYLLIIKFLIYTIAIFGFTLFMLGYSWTKLHRIDTFRAEMEGIKVALKNPIVVLTFIAISFFIEVLLMRFHTLQYFFSASSLVWLATRLVQLVMRRDEHKRLMGISNSSER